MSDTFQALVVHVSDDKNYTHTIEERHIDDLPKGEVLIRVKYSSLNYKDALSCIGNRGVTRHYPHTPGIDAAGVIESSSSNTFKTGEPVIIMGSDLGMNTPGGFGQFIRVPSDWVMPLPKNLSLRESMILGTAGYTAALSVKLLQNHGVTPDKGKIAVTGSTGGVGCISVAILSKIGYSVSASTGKTNAVDFLMKLGASEVIGRDIVNDKYEKPLLKETWAGAIDTVGGLTLATLIKACKEGGAVAATGMVASTNLPTTVLPFILRGVSLLGINSQGTSMSIRKELWLKLSEDWKPDLLEHLAFDCRLQKLGCEIDRMLAGEHIGRVILDLT